MRIFLAINFPDEMRRRLWEASAPLRDGTYPVKWVRPDLIHLTLKFLGEVHADDVSAVERAARNAVTGARNFPLPVDGFGTFPRNGAPRVVWAGCEPVPPLELLQDRMERAMAAVGYPIEGRPFRPHLTLGRARRDARPGDWSGFRETLDGLDFQAAPEVASVDVMESVLGRDGPRYSIRAAIPLED